MQKTTDKVSSAIVRLDRRRIATLRKTPAWFLQPVRVAPGCIEVVANLVDRLNLGRRDRQKKIHLLESLVCNLILAHRAGKALAVSRSTAAKGVRLQSQLLDQLEALNLVVCRKGSMLSGKLTLYDFSVQGSRVISKYGLTTPEIVDMTIARVPKNSKDLLDLSLAPVVLKNKDFRAIPFRKTPELRRLEDRILAINESNLRHSWMFYREEDGRLLVEQPFICFRAIYNRDFKHGGRFYAPWITGYTHLPKRQRRTMLIDSEPIAELDYSGFHPRLLYHKLRLACSGDVYRPFEIVPEWESYKSRTRRETASQLVRRAIKRLTNTCLNARSQGQANSSAGKFFIDDRKTARIFRRLKVGPKELISRIQKIHEPISEYFFTGVGSLLNASDDQPLMLGILERFTSRGLPALGLHDALIVKKSDVLFAEQVMRKEYLKCYEFSPEIKRAY